MLRKTFLALVALAALSGLVYWIVLQFASDETRIRWLLESMESAYNDGSARALADGLADEFRADGLERAQVVLAFAAHVRANLDSQGEYLYRCRLVPEGGFDSLVIDDASTPATAELVTRVEFRRRSGRAVDGEVAQKVVGTVEFEARLIVEDGDWRIAGAKRRLVEGSLPY